MAFALHACGSATDYAMLQAARVRAAYIVSPCCIGKVLQLSTQTVTTASSEDKTHIASLLSHPRSR